MADWNLLSSKEVITTPWLTLVAKIYEVPEHESPKEFYVVSRKSFVVVVAIVNDHVVLVRQFRPGTGHTYLALPAGYLEPGEEPQSCGERELMEETGYRAATSRVIGHLDPLPGYVSSTAHIVVAQVDSSVAQGKPDTEVDEIVLMDWDKAIEMVLQGQINEMQAAAALLLAREWMKRKP